MSEVSLLEIFAPVSGVLVPIKDVPDPVFATGMVGDGVSIDPTGAELFAPVAGVVTHLHKAHHALTITTAEGLEVLIHVGVDTVALKGRGFFPRVAQGESVRIGQPLLGFDADYIARHAPSLLTQVLIANGDRVRNMAIGHGPVEAGRDVVLRLSLVHATNHAESGCDQTIVSCPVILPNAEGLHARPAAVLAAAAKQFKAQITLVRNEDEANGKSVVSIMVLATKRNDAIRVRATGPDARQAVRTITELLAAGCGEKGGEVPTAPIPLSFAPAPLSPVPSQAEHILAGVPAAPGLAVGTIAHWQPRIVEVIEAGEGAEAEARKMQSALHEARRQIESLKSSVGDPNKAQILDAHLELLEDPELMDRVLLGLDGGVSAAWAWRDAYQRHADQLAALPSPLLRERASDIRDIGQRVLLLLAGGRQTVVEIPENSILVAEELTPSETIGLDRNRVLGFCTTTGGATSHVAILARSLGIPAICGIATGVLDLPDGTLAVLDGGAGILNTRPDETELARAREGLTRQEKRRETEKADAMHPAVTTDGQRIEIVANIRNADEARAAVEAGGEGVGLLRSEFLFEARKTAPSEDEQAMEYLAVADALGAERPLVIRSLDAGGDKPLPYLVLPREENPFLGLRGIRVSLYHPDIFRPQLRAMLRAVPAGNVHIMFPMVSTLAELRAAKAILAEEEAALGLKAKVGVMIEVPSAALMADLLAPEVDFFSIGTNDLTQYALAMDRGHPQLARQADALDPAVLRLIAMTATAARKHRKWVGVCGGMAAESLAVPVLIGLGVTELSVPIPAIAATKAQVKRLSLERCRVLADEVLQLGTAEAVRARLIEFAE